LKKLSVFVSNKQSMNFVSQTHLRFIYFLFEASSRNIYLWKSFISNLCGKYMSWINMFLIWFWFFFRHGIHYVYLSCCYLACWKSYKKAIF